MRQQDIPLIDREILFGNPEIMGAKISPDGTSISFIKPYEGMLNIWVKKVDESFEDALPITNDQKRPIMSYFWSRDSSYILYVQDKGGDENYHLYAVDPSSRAAGIPEARDLTPTAGIRAMIYALPKNNHDQIILGINDRDPAWHDLYSVDISSGAKTLITKNEHGFNAFYFDLNYNLSLASKSTADAGTELLLHKAGTWTSLITCSGDENISILKHKDDHHTYVNTNLGDHDLGYLGLMNLENGNIEVLESDPNNKVDFGGALFSDRTNQLIGTSYTFEKSLIYWKDEDFEADYNWLKKEFKDAEVHFMSGTDDERKWIIGVNSDVDPGATYFFDRDTKSVDFLYRPRPNLPTKFLNHMEPISYKSIDELSIHGYLTKPSVEDQGAAIIMPHGGPWVRDNWGYHSYAQFLSNRGYLVLQVNYRGSTGYGKSFLNGGDLEWGRRMQDDLTYGVKFLVDEVGCDPKRIGILGGSYGGYATLAGLTFTPDVYACGVSIVGPSNLFTLLESIPAYWESARAMFHKRMGDPQTEEGKALMKERSPFFHADKIKAPLLVGQGDNDPRVKTAESDQIVEAMQSHDLPVEYLNFPDEGHGFANPQNSMAFLAVVEKFLAKHLGGRYQEEIPEHHQTIIDRVTVV